MVLQTIVKEVRQLSLRLDGSLCLSQLELKGSVAAEAVAANGKSFFQEPIMIRLLSKTIIDNSQARTQSAGNRTVANNANISPGMLKLLKKYQSVAVLILVVPILNEGQPLGRG